MNKDFINYVLILMLTAILVLIMAFFLNYLGLYSKIAFYIIILITSSVTVFMRISYLESGHHFPRVKYVIAWLNM